MNRRYLQLPFTKMIGAGNDFLVVDARDSRFSDPRNGWAAISKSLCERRCGIGADGMLVLERSQHAHARMRIFNPDGSEAQMCGNGARCAALYICVTQTADHPPKSKVLARSLQCAKSKLEDRPREKCVTIETKAGVLAAKVRADKVLLSMTQPSNMRSDISIEIDGRPIKVWFLNTGVPHAIILSERAGLGKLDDVDVNRIGRYVRNHPRFKPDGANVDFIESCKSHPDRLRIRTYERGVEAETPACGTGVVASAIIYTLTELSGSSGVRADIIDKRYRSYTVKVETKSGDLLRVSFKVHNQSPRLLITDVVLEGPAHVAFKGEISYFTCERR